MSNDYHFETGDRVRVTSHLDHRGRPSLVQEHEGTVTSVTPRKKFSIRVPSGSEFTFTYPWQDRIVEVLAPLRDRWLVPLTPEEDAELREKLATDQGDDDHAARIYLAGPMRGLPGFNYPAFHAAASTLRALRFEVFNPAELFDGDTTLPFETYMRKDLDAVVNWADEVWVLPGWQQSDGARTEVTVARALGKRVVDYATSADVDVTSLPVELEAATHVYGARQASYGHPASDFERTGRIWGAILGIPDVPPAQVALCMAGLKISREVNKPKRDNIVDLIGYAICEARITGHEPDPGEAA